MNEEQLKAIKARQDAARQNFESLIVDGAPNRLGNHAVLDTNSPYGSLWVADCNTHEVAAFFAAAAADIDMLLGEVTDLRRQVADLEELLRREEARG